MKTRTCPNCHNEVTGDPQHCHVCQSGLRPGRLNLPGRLIYWIVFGGSGLALLTLFYLGWNWWNLPEITLATTGVLALKVVGVGVAWYCVFFVAQILEGFARLK